MKHFRQALKESEKENETREAEKLMRTIPGATDQSVELVRNNFMDMFRERVERCLHMNYFLTSRMLVGLKNLQDQGTMLVQNGTRPSLVNV